ncbi:MAG TPA: energy transducer TonB [Pseudolabrys sp.]|nr:energy transducer TonB [Pseudolabrys sp.]
MFFHVGGAMALLAKWHEDSDLVASAPVVMVELAPVPVAPQIVPNELPPGPEQTEAEPEPEPPKQMTMIEQKPDDMPKPELAVTPPPKPPEKPKEHKPRKIHASLTSAPSVAEHRAERAAAPMPGATARDPNAVPNWKSLLVATLERHKRYPPEAQSRGDHGTAQLAFSVDRHGGVHNARIVRSSGSRLLDEATLSLVERAQPLPPPPPEVPGAQIAISVPIRYNIR